MDISVVIPVHEFNESVGNLLTKAIKSVFTQKDISSEDAPSVVLVYAHSIESEIQKFVEQLEFKEKINLVKNENKTDFQSQINLGVDQVKTSYFVILEFDDELSDRYFRYALQHVDRLKNVDLFLPMIVEVNDNNEALKITNETVWSKQFVGENGTLGYLNSKSLNQYTDFKISGGLFKKSEFVAVGKLKSNIQLTFTYEFLLRLLNNGGVIYTIPKIGVKHFATREGSLFHTYSVSMPLKERKFWFETAKKESNFFNDRVIDLSPIQS